VLASSLENDKVSGNDERNYDFKENTNDENLAINMNERKEIYPILENKHFSNPQGQVVEKNS